MKTTITLLSTLALSLVLTASVRSYTSIKTVSTDQVMNQNPRELLINDDELINGLMLTCAYRGCGRKPKQAEAIHQFRSSLILPKKQLDQRI